MRCWYEAPAKLVAFCDVGAYPAKLVARVAVKSINSFLFAAVEQLDSARFDVPLPHPVAEQLGS